MVAKERLAFSILLWAAMLTSESYGQSTQTYFVPVDEEHILDIASAINLAAPAPPASETVHTVLSLSATSDGTVVYYDHWEDGYEADPTSPVQASTQTINLDAGDFTVLENDVFANPRDPGVILFDARDRLSTSDQIAITRAGWRLQEGTLLAGAVEVFPTFDWGTEFEAPVGEDLAFSSFEYVSASVTAAELGAVFEVDLDGDGTADQVRRLGPGETTLVGGILTGSTFLSSDPIEVHLLTGDRGSNFAGRWLSLVPREQWSDSYYTSVGTPVLGRDTVVTLYNPGTSAVTVTTETLQPQTTVRTFETTTAGALDAGTSCAAPLVRTINVGTAFTVSDSNVGFVADHTYRGDIQMILQSPSGTRLTVLATNGGDGNNNYDLELDDTSDNPLNDGDADATGMPFYDRSAGPSVSMGLFVGEPAAGLWQLEICDTFGGADDGTFLRARLELSEITGFVPTTSNVNVPAGGVATFTMPQDSGGHFFTAGGERFFALAAADFEDSAHDWGFTLLPEENLTTTLVVGWAPGRDPTSATNPSENGSPIWFTATAATDVYVDFDGDPTTGALVDPNGDQYDLLVPVTALQSVRLFDTDGDQSGARLYTLDGTLITAAWGQDPATASPAQPALDLGTTVLPIARVRVVKEGLLIDDVDGDGGIDPGERIRYTITVTNVSDAIVPDVILEDIALDPNLIYAPDTTEIDGLPLADDGVGVTVFPLDEGGVSLGSLAVDQVVVITFEATVLDPLGAGVVDLTNVVEVRAGPETETDTENVPVGDPELLISKTSDATGDLVAGDLVSYAVTVTNTAGVTHRGIKVLDSLPNGVSYVAESTSVAGFAVATLATAYDNATAGTVGAATPCATPLVRTFIVTDTFDLTDLELGFRANHIFRGDIQAVLQSPAGTRVTVIATSGADGNNNYDVMLVDGAGGALNDGNADDTAAPFYDRTISPSNALSAFLGEAAAGTWQLEMCDTFVAADDGTFLSAQLVVRGEATVAATKTNQAAAALPLLDGVPTNLVLAPDAFELQPAQVMTITYQVMVADPLDINTTAIINTAFATSIQQPFPVQATVVDPVSRGGVIGDRVWLDADGDGVQDLGEPGLANITVQLVDPGPDGQPGGGDDGVLGTAVTDANGSYLFDHLSAGDYFVAVDDTTLPAGLATSPGTTDPSAVVTLLGEEEILDVDFGYTNADPLTGIIGDFVWSDADADGIQDAGEIGLGGVDVELVDGGGNVVATTTTAADGSYLFAGVAPGEHRVRIAAAELGAGGALDGFTATVGPQSEGGSLSDPVTVGAGDVLLDVDFGFTNPAGTFSVADAFWLDLDADGVRDPDEPAIAGVTVDLLDASGNIIGTATSAADGSFSFDGVPPGNYTLSASDNGGALVGLGGTTDPARLRMLAVTVVAADLAGVNFGFNAVGSLGDRIWSDSNGDGVQDPQELGLSGVMVELLDRNGSVIATTVTDASGNYLFEGLAPDQFTVRVDTATLPAGFAQTADPDALLDDESTVTLDFGDSDLSLDFGYRNTTLPDLSGTVFEDLDADGLEEAGEPGFAGVTVELQRVYEVIDSAIDLNGDGVINGLDSGFLDGIEIINGRPDVNGDGVANGSDDGVFKGFGVIDGRMDMNGDGSTAGPDRPLDDGTIVCTGIATATTDAAGGYSFPDLPDGDYIVAVTDQAGVLEDYQLTSGLDALPVTIAGVDVMDIDFGYVRDAETASIGDVLWLDGDRDGVQDAGEPGAAGVTVELFDAGPDGVIGGGDDLLVATTLTDAKGGYVFDGLTPGSYYVVPVGATLPAGFVETTYPMGTDPSAVIALSEGEDFDDADFGYVPAVGSAIGDTVWLDFDGDGVEDPGEVGISGVDIEISGPGGTITVTTDATGTWLATGLVPGSYFATVDISTLPAGLTPTPTNADVTYTLDVAAGTDYFFLDWGFTGGTFGSIGDRIWLDANGDGIQNGGEDGIESVTVNLLDDMGAVIATTVTDTNGDYDFTGVPAGSYTVEVTDIGGVLAGLNLSSPPVGTIVLTAGQDFDDADFGYAPSGGIGSIGDQVFWDQDGDGVLDAGEPGFEGVTLDLWLDVDGDGLITPGVDNLLRTETTDANGEYAFTGLVSDDYLVDVTDTAGVLSGFTHTLGTAGVDDNSQADPYAVTLSSESPSDTTADFGYFAPAGLSISGTVFEDSDEDAAYDQPDELPVAGVLVELFRVVNGAALFVGSTVTDASGDYSFDGLPPGDYVIRAVTSGSSVDGWRQTTQTGSGGVAPVTLVATDSTDNDFGFFDGGIITNPVTLAFFHADGAGFSWATETEVGNIGFRLYRYRSDDDRWTRVSDEIVPSDVVDSVLPQHYRFEPIDATGDAFVLEDIDVRGRSRFHGPFALDKRYGTEIRTEAIDWLAVHEARKAADLAKRAVAGSAAAAPVDAVDLRVTETGLQRVTYEAVLAAGLDLARVRPDRIAITRGGEPVARYIEGGAVVGPGSVVEFLGEARDDLYTDTEVYRLRIDASAVVSAMAETAPPVENRPEASYLATRTFERQRQYSFGAPSEDPWFDTQLLAISGPKMASFPLALDHWLPDGSPVFLEVRYWGVTDWPLDGDHHVVIEVNGVPVADDLFDGLTARTAAVELDSSLLTGDGTDQVTVRLPHDTGVAFDLVYVDGWSVRYPRAFVAEDGQLEFTATGQGFQVDGLTSDQVVVWREGFAGVKRFSDLLSIPSDLGYLAVVPAEQGGRLARYHVTSLDQAKVPDVVPSRLGDDVLVGDAELLIISHPDFIDGLAPLVAARRREGLSVRVVDVEDVFGRYTSGVFDPAAIQAFVAEAHRELRTRYVLLVGADTYDYRDYLGLGALSFIPTLYAQTDAIVRHAPADSLFGDVDGDFVPEVAVGRFPVRTAAELDSVVTKTLDYPATPARTAILAADGFDLANRYSFRRDSEAVALQLGDTWSIKRSYIDDLGLTGARQKLIDDMDRGASLVSFFGHSGPSVWSFSGLFTASDAAGLGNAGRPMVVTQWGCWNTYYVSPAAETLGQRFMTSGDRGAAAVLGATTLTTAESERRLGLRVFDALTRPGVRLGDAVVWAKQDLARDQGTDGLLDVLIGWTILGDPTLEVFH